jgi:hypothetical protein
VIQTKPRFDLPPTPRKENHMKKTTKKVVKAVAKKGAKSSKKAC